MAWVGPHIPCDEGGSEGVGVEACVVWRGARVTCVDRFLSFIQNQMTWNDTTDDYSSVHAGIHRNMHRELSGVKERDA